MLTASSSIAGKFGLNSTDGLTLFTLRFLGAGVLLLGYVHLTRRERLPAGKEWVNVFIFGAVGTAFYLGLLILALESVTAGITSLAISLNPLFIGIFTSIWMNRKVKLHEWLSVGFGIAGVAIATYPMLHTAHVSVIGLILLALSMISYSIGSVYYASVSWKLSRTAINGWQAIVGGILLLPFAILTYNKNNQYDLNFWISLAWLIVPVSIFAVQLWLYLLNEDAMRASLWLFLCPIFGLGLATFLLDEPFAFQTAIGAVVVLFALYLGQKAKIKKAAQKS